MNNNQFKKELEQIIPLVTKYATNYYNVTSYKDISRVIKKFGKESFINKCHAGFKIAQEKILENILFIENELEKENIILERYSKGKKKTELKKDKKFTEYSSSIEILRFQRAAFQETANVIVWTVLFMQRTHIKSFLQYDGGSGYLKDRDIDTVVDVAREINKKDEDFALICDITSTLHLGDLLIRRNGRTEISEVKSGSKINNIILEIVHAPNIDKDINYSQLKKLHRLSKRHGIKQLQRHLKQTIKALGAINYMETDEGYDWIHKKNKKAIPITTPDENNYYKLNRAIEDFYKSGDRHKLFQWDDLLVGIFKIDKKRDSNFVTAFDFKHMIYHVLVKSWEECQYANLENIDINDNFVPELIHYQNYEVSSLKNLIFIPTHKPLFLLLKKGYAIDLLTNCLSVYIYFNVDSFIKRCQDSGAPVELFSVKRAQKIIKQTINKRNTPLFSEKCIVLINKKFKMVFGGGLLYRLIYELQTSKSLINQCKENMLQETNPWLLKLFRLKITLKERAKKFYYLYIKNY